LKTLLANYLKPVPYDIIASPQGLRITLDTAFHHLGTLLTIEVASLISLSCAMPMGSLIALLAQAKDLNIVSRLFGNILFDFANSGSLCRLLRNYAFHLQILTLSRIIISSFSNLGS